MAGKGGKQPGAGRKPKTFDWEEVGRLCHIQCTHVEIVSILETTKDTLYLACQRDIGIDFSTFYAQKADGGKRSLRRKQWVTAVEDGNPTMLIWLGKQVLSQAEKSEGKFDMNLNLINDFVIKLVKPDDRPDE